MNVMDSSRTTGQTLGHQVKRDAFGSAILGSASFGAALFGAARFALRPALPGLAAALLALTTSSASAAAGSYSSETAGPVIQNKKSWYTSVHPPVGSPPREGKITTVSWRWGVSGAINGLDVKLCYRNAQDCVPVTSYGRAMTQAFAGRPADGSFLLMYRVEGSGRMAPVYGERSQVTVNYTY